MPKGMGGMGGMGGMNMNNLMKQAQKMQRQMADMQTELESKTYEVSSGGGAVKIVINGKKEVQEINISPDVVDPGDVEMLQDLVLTAVNEAIRQVEESAASQMGKITGGMGLPGGLF
ncbi:MAG: YbaB/EbfC family nucleoid-associated protein [Defluviitaleaceae bacterium]|nr:YbaB/EbfC family nucleoid-associated protein [Defluviitaleaceae bacterium]